MNESTTTEITGAPSEDAEPPTESDGAADAMDGEYAADRDAEADEGIKSARTPSSHLKLTTLVGIFVLVALAALLGWLGFQSCASNQAKERSDLFLQVGRQGAINLTTIDCAEADTDVRRILDSATGTFYDDFSKRTQPFVDVVKQAQSKSVGTVTEAGRSPRPITMLRFWSR
jgi:Mce-associated membrane protein